MRAAQHSFKHQLELLYRGVSRRARIFGYTMLAFDVLFIIFVIVTSFADRTLWIEIADHVLALVVVLDFAARLYVSRHRARDLMSPAGIADIVVIFSLLAPLAGEGFAFLRVLRTLRLLRSYQLLALFRRDFKYFRANELTFIAAINLAVFVFVMTAIVFETQHLSNPNIANYADALYFTVTTLTTTGFGDITMTGPGGRLLAVAIMIFGVSLFIRLIQVMLRPPRVAFDCTDCGLKFHESDAVHCKHCGRVLNIESDGAT